MSVLLSMAWHDRSSGGESEELVDDPFSGFDLMGFFCEVPRPTEKTVAS